MTGWDPEKNACTREIKGNGLLGHYRNHNFLKKSTALTMLYPITMTFLIILRRNH